MPNINHCDSDSDSDSPICVNIDTHSDTSSSNNNINIDVNSDASSFNNSNASSSCYSHTNINIDSNSDDSFHNANVNIDLNSDTSFHNTNVNIDDVNSDISSSEDGGCNNIIDIAVLYNYMDEKPMTNFVKLKLVPIEVDFYIFKNLFFKRRSRNLDIRFLDILFNKLKASLINNILDFYKFSVKTKILFQKEVFALVISEAIKKQVFLNLNEIILLEQLQKYKSIVSRITLNLWVHTLSLGLNIEFLFNIKDIKDIIIGEKKQQIDLFNNDTCENDDE